MTSKEPRHDPLPTPPRSMTVVSLDRLGEEPVDPSELVPAEKNAQVDAEDTLDDLLDADSVLSRKRRRRFIVGRVAYIILMNCAIPITLYYILKPYLPPVWALVLSGTPTILSVIAQAVFARRIDSVGIAVIFGFLLSVTLAAVNGDPKLLLMRESFVTAGIGFVCAITLIPIRIKSFQLKPVLFYLANDLIPLRPVYFTDSRPAQKRLLFYWLHSRFFRCHTRLLTALNVAILEIEFGLKLFFILTLHLDTVVVVSSVIISSIFIIMSLINFWYTLCIRKRMRQDEPVMLQQNGAIL